MSENAADRLYGLFPEEFTAERNRLAAQLKKEGRAEEAEAVRALPKPTVAAWAVNQLARRRRRQLDAFLKAAENLRKAQAKGGDAFAKARDAERAARGELVELARDLVGEAGRKATEAVLSAVRATLDAAAADPGAAAAVREGRLTRELEPVGFGAWDAMAPSAPRYRGPSRAELRKAAQEELREARGRAQEARDELRAAEKAVEAAEQAAAEARGAVEAAEAAVEDAEARLRDLT